MGLGGDRGVLKLQYVVRQSWPKFGGPVITTRIGFRAMDLG